MYLSVPCLRGGLTKRARGKWVISTFLLGFVVIQVGLAWMLETSVGVSIDHEFQCHLHQVQSLREAFAGKPFLLGLGSSRFQMAFDPEAIEYQSSHLVYNGAIAGFGATQIQYALGRYLKAGLRPDHLLVEINPGWVRWDPPIHTALQMERMTIQESFALMRYAPDFSWTVETLARQRAIPSHSLRKKLLTQIAPQWLPHQTVASDKTVMFKYGGARIDVPFVPEDRRAIHIAAARKQYEEALGNFRISEASEAALCDLLTFCQKEKISVGVVLTPEGPAFREMYRAGARAEFVAWIEKIASAHQAEVIDTWTWCIEEDFWDSHHMLAKPAIQYTRRLWTERLLPWLAPKPTGFVRATSANH